MCVYVWRADIACVSLCVRVWVCVCVCVCVVCYVSVPLTLIACRAPGLCLHTLSQEWSQDLQVPPTPSHHHVLGVCVCVCACLPKCGYVSTCSCFPCVPSVLTVGVHSYYEVVPHGLGLSELVGVAVMHHIITAGAEKTHHTAGQHQHHGNITASRKYITRETLWLPHSAEERDQSVMDAAQSSLYNITSHTRTPLSKNTINQSRNLWTSSRPWASLQGWCPISLSCMSLVMVG